MDPLTQVCKSCKNEKPLTEYNKRAASASGYDYQCKSCSKTYYSQTSRQVYSRWYYTYKALGYTLEEVAELEARYNGKCEICEKPIAKRRAADHDHRTGRFRGWLCFDCNTALGKFGDSIEMLHRVIAYLQRSA